MSSYNQIRQPNLISRALMPLQRIRRWLIRQNPRPALNDLDEKLEKYLNFRNGFYIEAGANDGYSQSNTYYLEKKRGWTGLLVEGIPELYEECKRNRPRSIVRHCALVCSDYEDETITMHYAHLMSIVDGSIKSKFDQEKYLEKGKKIQNLTETYSINVRARKLESILDEISAPDIDFFSLDVEGYELDVLRGLNLIKYRPKYILVEAWNFEEVNNYLVQHEFEFLSQLSTHDFLYQRKEVQCQVI